MQTDFSRQIKEKALEIGFSACGITDAGSLSSEQETSFMDYLERGFHADMRYLQRNTDKRMHPQLLVEGAQSIIVVLLNYHHPEYHENRKSSYIVSEYALGEDYHLVMKDKLSLLIDFIAEHQPKAVNCGFSDTHPVLEKHLACKAGLGTIGKNTLLLTSKGSYYFIGEIFTTLLLDYDAPLSDNPCLHCERCLKACPTQALRQPYRLNANKCISYHTIENKNDISLEIVSVMGKHIYGCDRCQQVCPCNQGRSSTKVKEFSPKTAFMEWEDAHWENLDETEFEHTFSDTVLFRVGYRRFKQILSLAKDNPSF
ncbi:MAG: tRNA epoxyqueuosine(34) reductase QueG [Bacteroidales bacterium]|nr:tRNA epoxyqueuosine(34) reductase QueG [Bacteroidales bacterium]